MAKRKRNRAEKDARRLQRRNRKAAKEKPTESGGGGDPLRELPPDLRQLMEHMAGGNWRQLGDGIYDPLASALRAFDRRTTVTTVAGLLCVPKHQAGRIRLEVLLHLALVHCRGTRAPTPTDLRGWLEHTLTGLPVRHAEDPLEDVIVSNVMAPGGNYRLFQGLWESSDRWLQGLLDAFQGTNWGQVHQRMLPPIVALLRLSDAVAERSGVERWTSSDATDPSDVFLARDIDIPGLQDRVTFTASDLASFGVTLADLSPFILPPSAPERMRKEALGHSTLERAPLVQLDGGVALMLPSAVSPAIRRYVVDECARLGELNALRLALRDAHYEAVVENALHLVAAKSGVGHAALPPESPPRPAGPTHWDEVLCPIDEDKVAQVLLLHPFLDAMVQNGLMEPGHLGGAEESLVRHVEATARFLTQHTAGGLIVMVIGGLGGGLALPTPNLPDGWHLVVMTVPNFETFAWSREASLLRIWKLQEQVARLAAGGVRILEINDTLTTYAYWVGQGFSFCPDEFPFPPTGPTMIGIGPEIVRDLRVMERQRHDVHAARIDAAGTTVRVRRLGSDAFFPSMRERPLYVAERLLRQSELAGVYEHSELTLWVWANAPGEQPAVREFVYQLWELLLSWIDRLVPQLTLLLEPPLRAGRAAPAVHVQLTLSEEPGWRHFTEPGFPVEARPVATLDARTGVVSVSVPFGFISMLRRPANDGERALLEAVSEALVTWLTREAAGPGSQPEASEAEAAAIARRAVRNAMGGENTRSLHMFEASGPIDELATRQPGRAADPRFLLPEDRAAWEDGLAWEVVDRATLHLLRAPIPAGPPDAPGTAFEATPGVTCGGADDVRDLVGRSVCMAALGALVDVLWSGIRERLSVINGPSLAALAVENVEAVFRDREHWRRTARPLIALYGATDEVGRISAEREGRRSAAANAARVLVEMSVCTSPREGGRVPSLADFDRLVAGVQLLVDLAFDSDAIRHGLAEPRLRVFPSGKIAADRSFVATLMNPFAVEVHSADFRAAADEYAGLYRARRSDESGVDPNAIGESAPVSDLATAPTFAPEFVRAFTAEYGIPPSRMLEGVAEMAGIGVDGESLVVSTTLGAVRERLVEARGFDAGEVAAFYRMLALTPREDWARTPKGFRARDWHPWRFRRRLSVVARPLVTFGDDDAAPLIFGMYQLRASVSYLFENMRFAWLPEEFFRSAEMVSYRGSVADAEGAAFTEEVAARLREAGWQTRTEVLMPTLQAPQQLGDLDVVAWRRSDNRLLLVECKRLQPARTVGEVGELLTQFRGETGDRLGKHLARCNWVREHRLQVARALGAPESATAVTPLLVTNRDVPMRFRSDLPLSPDQIVPLSRLATIL